MNEAVKPEISVDINQECDDYSVLSVKLTDEANGCIIAYSSIKSAIAFKRVVIIIYYFVCIIFYKFNLYLLNVLKM